MLDHFADLSAFQTEGRLLYSSSESDAESAYAHLKGASHKFVVYRRGDAPKSLHYDENERDRDPVVVASGPFASLSHVLMWRIRRTRCRRKRAVTATIPQQFTTMRAIFHAIGPDIRPNTTVPRCKT
ncbi:MAG TPA: hypothetical protein VMU26_27335 [Candidatus Polarisedimenticolia bacterium]|nr:hypothetical protein [Candidatus Polarisedimenticolia bacterium]